MPLVCINKKAERIIAPSFSESDWIELKRSYREHGLALKCCGAQAIPKTSIRGLQFFSHKSNACDSAPESKEHLSCKEEVFRAFPFDGWITDVEVEGMTPDGQKWIADVMCRKDGLSIAIEIQFAYQTYDEYRLRTQRYRDCGVDVLWLISDKKMHALVKKIVYSKQERHPEWRQGVEILWEQEDLPLFSLKKNDAGEFKVLVRKKERFGVNFLSLAEFSRAAVERRLKFLDGYWILELN
jgi:competence CoiA-like predicted nuclease